MNRTLLTLNLNGNRISDTGTKAISEVLTSLTLTHDEIVARRRLISENKSSTASDEVSFTHFRHLNAYSAMSTVVVKNEVCSIVKNEVNSY